MLIRVTNSAHNALLDQEDLEQDKLADLRNKYLVLAKAARVQLAAGGREAGTPEA